LLHIEGNARGILTAERTALNFLQTLSGTATTTHQWTEQIKSTSTKILDTRKTLPGLRTAQKYAVAVGGGQNHRMGLYDQFLIKENHIMAAGSLEKAVERARQNHPEIIVEVEVETLDEYEQALAVGADIIMLDNFSVTDIIQAVTLRSQHLARCKLEVSGGIEQAGLLTLAQTGIDYISVGALTKHLRAIDLSMRFSLQPDD
jgi:nicotinate-nucleotide pyrophosphorylase (carboxylating)